jgi:hypothetical protein
MTYQLYKPTGSNGLNPIPVPDNAIDTALYDSANKLGVQLVGRNAIDYGTAVAQNTIQMVSNFSGTILPSDAIALQGQLWFNATSSTVGNLYVRVTSNVSGGILNWEQVVTSGSGNAPTATKLQTARNITATGDASWTVLFDGSANVSSALTLATVNASVGSFGSATQVPVFTVDAKGRITSVTNTTITSPPAAGLAGGAAGDLPYQSAPNTTAFLPAVASGEVLISQGVSTPPAWSNAPTFIGSNITGTAGSLSIGGNATTATTAGSATTASSATTATNVAGGVTGSLVYQSNPSATALLAPGTAGQVLITNGAGFAPSWASGPASIGYNQTWQSFTIPAQRASGTTYTNTTGRPIMVAATWDNNSGTTVVIGSVTILSLGAANITVSGSWIIPPGDGYSITAPTSISVWSELR